MALLEDYADSEADAYVTLIDDITAICDSWQDGLINEHEARMSVHSAFDKWINDQIKNSPIPER